MTCHFWIRAQGRKCAEGLEVVSYLVSLGRYSNYLHLCSSVYTHTPNAFDLKGLQEAPNNGATLPAFLILYKHLTNICQGDNVG